MGAKGLESVVVLWKAPTAQTSLERTTLLDIHVPVMALV